MKPIYQAVVTSEGGRKNGHVKSADGIIDFEMDMPKELGGAGGKPNPELLFAAGYSACFETALQVVAEKRKTRLESSKVVAHVTLGSNASGGFELETKLQVYLPGLGREDGTKIMQEAHTVCPYSNATKGNMKVELEFMEE